MIDPLAGGLVMATVGATLLGLYLISIHRKAIPVRSLISDEPMIVARLAVGNLIMNVGYVLGIHFMGIGVITSMTAMGPLCVGGGELWSNRGTLKGALHIALRAVAGAGVLVVNKPWVDFRCDQETIIGILCGLLGAWSFWNYIRVFFGDRIPVNKRVEYVAVADLISLPFIAFAVWGVSPVVGGGYDEITSLKVIIVGAIAGVVGFLLPTIIAGVAAGKVKESVSGILYTFDTPIAALMGLLGASVGLTGSEQAPDQWGWFGMAVIFAVALSVALLAEPPKEGLPDEGR
jgi:threonine/homoserine efflux transporter RhtA